MHLVDSVLSMPKAFKKLTEMEDPDRAWLVAGLTVAGWTGLEIAQRTGCSRRLVMGIRSWDMTQMARFAQEQVKQADARYHAERTDHLITLRKLDVTEAEAKRLRAQMKQLVDAHLNGQKVRICHGGHPQVPYNVYRNRDCRECHRERQARYRAAKRLTCAMLEVSA